MPIQTITSDQLSTSIATLVRVPAWERVVLTGHLAAGAFVARKLVDTMVSLATKLGLGLETDSPRSGFLVRQIDFKVSGKAGAVVEFLRAIESLRH